MPMIIAIKKLSANKNHMVIMVLKCPNLGIDNKIDKMNASIEFVDKRFMKCAFVNFYMIDTGIRTHAPINN